MNLAVLASGGGTTFQNLIDRIAAGSLHANIKTLITSRPAIAALDRAARAGIPAHVIDRKTFSSAADFSRAVFELCDDQQIDLVCLAGWLCMLNIAPRYAGRVMNIHPAL